MTPLERFAGRRWREPSTGARRPPPGFAASSTGSQAFTIAALVAIGYGLFRYGQHRGPR